MKREVFSAPNLQSNRFRTSSSQAFSTLNFFKWKDQDEDQLQHQIKPIPYESPNQEPTTDFKQLQGLVQIRNLTPYELLEIKVAEGELNLAKQAAMRLILSISEICSRIVRNSFFQIFILTVIVANTITLAMQTPNQTNTQLQQAQTIFLYIYTGEAVLKILGIGLIKGKNAYFRQKGNILDFLIVLTGWVQVLAKEGVNLSAVRALRILRPLKSISSIQGMRVIFKVLMQSMKLLLSTLLILFFVFLVFAIAGLNLWMGVLRFRCLNTNSGILQEEICGLKECSALQECVEGLDNPNYGVTNFDNIFYSMLVVFQVVTLEGWAEIMIFTQKAFSYWSFLYFIPLVFLGAFFLINITLAVIKMKFTDIKAKEFGTEKQVQEQQLFVTTISFNYQSMCIPQSFSQNQMESLSSFKPEKPEQSKDRLRIVENNSNYGIMNFRKATSVYDNQLSVINFREFSQERILDATLMQQHKEQGEIVEFEEKELKIIMKRKELINLAADDSLKKQLQKGESKEFKFNLIKEIELNLESKNDILATQIQQTKEFRNHYTFQYTRPKQSLNKQKKPIDFIQNKLFQKQIYNQILYNVQQKIYSTIQDDYQTNYILGKWSGGDVTKNPQKRINPQLINMNFRLWKPGWSGQFQKLQHIVFILISSKAFNYLMTLCVIVNTVVLAMDHHGISSEMQEALNIMNIIFTSIFTAEMVFKLTGLGIQGYSRDNMNYIDGLVVILSLLELIFLSESSAFSAFRTIRIFRTFRILRVARLFRYLQEMSRLIEVIGRSIATSLYLALLLLIFIMIFALLGMEIFGGKFDFPQGKPRANFDNFHQAFVTVFQLLSTENWYSILFDGIRATSPIAALFFVVWIFLGNFVLLNLFLAILLDSFVSVGEIQAENKGTRYFKRRQTAIYNLQSRPISEGSQQSIPLTLRALSKQSLKVQKSVFIFTKKNVVRRLCSKLVQSSHFQHVILVIIVLSSMKLVFDTYIIDLDEDSIQKELSFIADIVFTIIFALEMTMKIITYGFVFQRHTYLRNSWNVLDMLIVVVSFIQLTIQNTNISAFKVLRILRTLRPLRFITHNIEMKIVVNALLNSFTTICNVGIVILIVWMMFAILGVSLFGGKFYQCENTEIEWKEDCEKFGFQWVNSDTNYDNVLQGMMALFIVSSLEGWPDIMYQSIDATQIGRAPKKNYQPLYAYYYVAFILIGSFFFLNLFIGALFKSFENAKQSQKAEYALILTRAQQKWHQILKLIPASKPVIKVAQTPTNSFRKWCYTISKSVYFDLFILGCIIVNMVQMGIMYYQASDEYMETLEIINLTLTCVFILQGVVKIIGLGLKSYFAYSWNKFDFFVILASITEIILAQTADSQVTLLRTGPQLARVFRVLRITKLLRVVKSLKDVQAILETIQYSLTSIINVLSLLLLIYFIYAILGVFLFYQVQEGTIIGEYTNFFNFGNAMLALFRISSGEEWNLVMYDCVAYNAPAAYTFFISYQIISGYVMLNLFIMVLLQTLDDHFENPESPVDIFNRTVKHFKTVWSKHSVLHGQKIHHKQMIDLMYDLGLPLGVSLDMPKIEVAKLITSLSIPNQDSGYVYYHDLLFCLYKKKFGTYRLNRIDNNQKIILMKQERATLRKVNELKKQILKQEKTYEGGRNEFLEENFVINPFQTFLIMRKVLVSWHNWTKQRKQQKMNPVVQELEEPLDLDQEG